MAYWNYDVSSMIYVFIFPGFRILMDRIGAQISFYMNGIIIGDVELSPSDPNSHGMRLISDTLKTRKPFTKESLSLARDCLTMAHAITTGSPPPDEIYQITLDILESELAKLT